MVIPPKCWPEEELRVLGGEEKITEAIENIANIILKRPGELWVQVYVGVLAGQNIPHLHYHINEPVKWSGDETEGERRLEEALDLSAESELLTQLAESPLKLFREANLVVAVESIARVGQCFIVPAEEWPLDQPRGSLPWLRSLARLLAKTTALYAKAFESKQGLATEFQLFFKFEGGCFIYGSYLPILNHLGSTETAGALISGGPFIHPWSPEETLERLQQFV